MKPRAKGATAIARMDEASLALVKSVGEVLLIRIMVAANCNPRIENGERLLNNTDFGNACEAVLQMLPVDRFGRS